MRGIDTNVLVRYVTNDDLKQAEVVDRLFHDCDAAGERLFVSVIVLCELNTTSKCTCASRSLTREVRRAADVAYALVRAASRLVSTPAKTLHPARYRDESRYGTHECVRHIADISEHLSAKIYDGMYSVGADRAHGQTKPQIVEVSRQAGYRDTMSFDRGFGKSARVYVTGIGPLGL